MPVNIFHKYSKFQTPSKNRLIQLIEAVFYKENQKPGDVNIIFVDNKEILSLNIEYLNHHYYTDVIAFYYTHSGPVEGDIFISLDKVYENSREYETGFENELIRVVVHGILHLMGYTDKTNEGKQQMRQLEDLYIEHYNLHLR
ncbi:MAG: rRNA maturation RNase YbeY [Bacteroidales bacterium]|nr:rRNA maturation RNase YbeY [Bacteroidales bacterium]